MSGKEIMGAGINVLSVFGCEGKEERENES